MASLDQLLPLLVVVPPQIGASKHVVSRPLWGTRPDTVGPRLHPVAPQWIPWVAVATGLRGDAWTLAPRTAAWEHEVDAAIGMELHQNLPWTYVVERESGWLRKSPEVLRLIALPEGCPGLPPVLHADLAMSLLLQRLALVQVAGTLQSLSLFAAVRGRNELLITRGEFPDVHAARRLFDHVSQNRGFASDFVFCIQVTTTHVSGEPRALAPIVGALQRHPDGSMSATAYDALASSDWYTGEEEEAESPPAAQPPLDDYQRKVLALIAREGKAHWRTIALRFPPEHGEQPRHVLREMEKLEALGLVKKIDTGSWALTGGAAAPRDEPPLLTALRAGFEATIRYAIPHMTDPRRLGEQALEAVNLEPTETVARNAATLIVTLDKGPLRDALFDRLLADPRPVVRAAVFDALAPPRVQQPGEAAAILPVDRIDTLIRTGLADDDANVRALAAKLAFASNRGMVVSDTLCDRITRHLDTALPDFTEEMHWTILALACASDDRSRALLVRTRSVRALSQPAILALGLRPDSELSR